MNARFVNARSRTYLALGLAAVLAAGAALAAPMRMARAQAWLPPPAAELGLAGAQAAQWDALREDALALHRIARDDLRDGLAELRALLDTPSPDLRAFEAEAQRRIDTHLAEARALRERQIALYESLPPDAQARVRAALAARLDRLARLRGRLAGFTDTGG